MVVTYSYKQIRFFVEFNSSISKYIALYFSSDIFIIVKMPWRTTG